MNFGTRPTPRRPAGDYVGGNFLPRLCLPKAVMRRSPRSVQVKLIKMGGRRLERHCVWGLLQITLHCLIAVLTYQATALAHVQQGAPELVRWMVPMVA